MLSLRCLKHSRVLKYGSGDWASDMNMGTNSINVLLSVSFKKCSFNDQACRPKKHKIPSVCLNRFSNFLNNHPGLMQSHMPWNFVIVEATLLPSIFYLVTDLSRNLSPGNNDRSTQDPGFNLHTKKKSLLIVLG